MKNLTELDKKKKSEEEKIESLLKMQQASKRLSEINAKKKDENQRNNNK